MSTPGALGERAPAASLVGVVAATTTDLRRRVVRMLLLRTLVVTVVLGLALWIAVATEGVTRAVWVQSVLIAATYLSTIAFGMLLRIGVEPRVVARPMWAIDLVVTSAFVYVTGGVHSAYTFLYALTIVSAGALSYRRGAVIVTLASIGGVTVASLLAWARVIDMPMTGLVEPWNEGGGAFARSLAIQAAALAGVGTLAFILGDQLQREGETLATTRRAAADLLTLHESIVRSLASGLITIASDGRVLTANDAAHEILGAPRDSLIDRSIDEVMPGLQARLVEARGELRRADLSLGDLVLGVTVSPLRDPDNSVIGRVINFSDLTELRRLEQHMRRAERLATVGQLAAGIAHEIRNPLASISGSIELLRAAPQTSDDDRALMAIVHREIQRLNELIGELLDYANPRPSQPVELDLAVLVRETCQVARSDQLLAGVDLTYEVDDSVVVAADPGKLRQVVWNLLRNAAEAAVHGGNHVAVAARRRGDHAEISVVDDGPGIPADKIARVFDPFFTTKKTGTGLGLAQCHAIVAEHGGQIVVESTARGTTMVVSLPARPLAS